MNTLILTLLLLTQVLTHKIDNKPAITTTTTQHAKTMTSTTTTNNGTSSSGRSSSSASTYYTSSTTTNEPPQQQDALSATLIIQMMIVLIVTCFVLALIVFICKNEFARTLLIDKLTQLKTFVHLRYFRTFRRIPDQSDNNNPFDIEEQNVLIMNKYHFGLWYILSKTCCCCLRKPIDYKIVDPQINDTIDNVAKEMFKVPNMTLKSWKIVLTKKPGKLIPITKGPHGELVEMKPIDFNNNNNVEFEEQQPLLDQFEIEQNIIKDD